MSNLRIAYLNRADSATITATTEASLMPVTYLLNDDRSLMWRSTTLTENIDLTWSGTAYSVGCVVLYGHNLAYGDTITVTGYPNADWTGTPTISTGAVSAAESGLFDSLDYGYTALYFTAGTVKSLRVAIASSSALGYIQARRLFVGPYTEALHNPQIGMACGWVDGSEQSRRPGGAFDVDVKGQWRSAAFDMMANTEADRATWFEIGRYVGTQRSCWVSMFPGSGGTLERDHAIYGRFTQSPLTKWADGSRYDKSISMEEI